MTDLVESWFGEAFAQLHPFIQHLHKNGGTLSGDIQLTYGTGLSGLVGRRLGVKLGLPETDGVHPLTVDISHNNEQLVWSREFTQARMVSVFTPAGNYPDGFWCEKTGSIELELGLEIKEGGWFWVQRRLRLMGVPIPGLFCPRTTAYKKIVDGKYEFGVELSYRFFGTFVKYTGLLDVKALQSNPA